MSKHYREIHEQDAPHEIVIPWSGVRPYRLVFKRVFDICAVLLAAPFLLPLIAILAIAVSRDGGKAFYSQKRVGRHGAIFTIWKLRTMVTGADQLLAEYLCENEQAAAEWQLTQKLKQDPRVTPIGHLLRKSSLDELPQLWNVLVGEMSLVGPRPMLPEQQQMYPGRCYYRERPGITGSWQVSKRNESTFADRARYDSDYIANMSFLEDLKLLGATVGVVVSGTGH